MLTIDLNHPSHATSYLDDARLFTDALGALQGQLAKVENHLDRPKPNSSELLKQVLDKAKTDKFAQYVQGSFPQSPQPGLAVGIDENVRLLSVLRTEMLGQVTRMEILQETLKNAMQSSIERANEGEVNDAAGEDVDQPCDAALKDSTDNEVRDWEIVASDALLAAGVVYAVKKDVVLIEKVTDAVSVLTSSADISSMRDDDFDASLLAEGLSGIIAGPSAGLEASRAFAAAALRPAPAASVAPLLVHLKQVVHGVIAAVARGDEIELDRESENLRSLTFALASTVGTARLETTDEGDLWQLTTTLWNASLSACEDPATESHAQLLHSLGSDIFEVVEGDHIDATRDVSQYIEFLCKMGREWDRLGHKERASWCLTHAVGYAKRLEALMASEQLAPEVRERCVLQLFNLYLQAATVSTRSQQQSLANNMLARALQLSKQEVVHPATAASMSLGIAELQVEQAGAMLLLKKESAGATALVLLASAEQHIEGTLLAAKNAGEEGLVARAEETKVQILMASAEAHVDAGEPKKAMQKLEIWNLEYQFLSLKFIPIGSRLVAAHAAAGAPNAAAEVLRNVAIVFHSNLKKGGHLQTPTSEFWDAWLDSFSMVLKAAGPTSSAAVAHAALEYVRAVHDEPQRLEPLVRCLLSQEGTEEISMKVLADNDVIVLASRDPKIKLSCYSMLRTLATQRFIDQRVEAAASLLTAALQYSPPEHKAKTAHLLAACNLKLGNAERTMQYLDIAGMENGGKGEVASLAAVVRMTAASQGGDTLKAQQGKNRYSKTMLSLGVCQDFHADVAAAAAQAAKLLGDKATEAGTAALAAKTLIPQDSSPGNLPPGQEASLLASWIAALLGTLTTSNTINPPTGTTGQDKGKHATAGPAAGILKTYCDPSTNDNVFKDLVGALKNATKRLKAIGAEQFGGTDNGIEKIAELGYRASLEALKCGAYDPCVTLASSTYVLLEEATNNHNNIINKKKSGGSDTVRDTNTGTGTVNINNSNNDDAGHIPTDSKSQVLLFAVQALLSTCRETASGNGTAASRLGMASKLLKRSGANSPAAASMANPVLQTAGLLFELEIASMQGNDKTMSSTLEKMFEAQKYLAASQAEVLLKTVAGAAPAIKATACDLLMKCSDALPLEHLAQLIGLAQGPEQQLKVCKLMSHVLSTTGSSTGTVDGGTIPDSTMDGTTATIPGDTTVPKEQENNLWQLQWLAATAFNLGAAWAPSRPRAALPLFDLSHETAEGLGVVGTGLKMRAEAAIQATRDAIAALPPSPPKKPKEIKNKSTVLKNGFVPPQPRHPPRAPNEEHAQDHLIKGFLPTLEVGSGPKIAKPKLLPPEVTATAEEKASHLVPGETQKMALEESNKPSLLPQQHQYPPAVLAPRLPAISPLPTAPRGSLFAVLNGGVTGSHSKPPPLHMGTQHDDHSMQSIMMEVDVASPNADNDNVNNYSLDQIQIPMVPIDVSAPKAHNMAPGTMPAIIPPAPKRQKVTAATEILPKIADRPVTGGRSTAAAAPRQAPGWLASMLSAQTKAGVTKRKFNPPRPKMVPNSEMKMTSVPPENERTAADTADALSLDSTGL